jgi:hypothetical protein
MAVVEYMFNIDDNGKRFIPGFIDNRGHWYDSATETYIGWVKDSRDFYVPDSLTTLSKEDLVQRQLSIHAVTPMQKRSEESMDSTNMTDAEVRTLVENWYDNFVTENS